MKNKYIYLVKIIIFQNSKKIIKNKKNRKIKKSVDEYFRQEEATIAADTSMKIDKRIKGAMLTQSIHQRHIISVSN